ncbi:MAG: XRE family transcriptional regulator [Sneathiellales bacterium]|nr:XRE family transcriptional regulator [Sneathiellales bacterium]
MQDNLTQIIALRLKDLRKGRGWSLADLADLSGVSRASLSRLENAEGSPTTEVLSKLCTAYGLTLTRLMSMVDEGFKPHIPVSQQEVFVDENLGFVRRSISPPAGDLAAEMLECRLEAGASVAYEAPPVKGQEHHLYLLEGGLVLTLEEREYKLMAGDCLRYHLRGANRFQADGKRGARYVLTLVS